MSSERRSESGFRATRRIIFITELFLQIIWVVIFSLISLRRRRLETFQVGRFGRCCSFFTDFCRIIISAELPPQISFFHWVNFFEFFSFIGALYSNIWIVIFAKFPLQISFSLCVNFEFFSIIGAAKYSNIWIVLFAKFFFQKSFLF